MRGPVLHQEAPLALNPLVLVFGVEVTLSGRRGRQVLTFEPSTQSVRRLGLAALRGQQRDMDDGMRCPHMRARTGMHLIVQYGTQGWAFMARPGEERQDDTPSLGILGISR
jgi:hypothetical protein